MIAPSSAASIRFGVTIPVLTNPVATALATVVFITKSAEKLKVAAQSTAANGLSTRVPTIVAMEFAES